MPISRTIPLLLLLAVSVRAASFDCKKARTPSEKLICATPELSALDDESAVAYRAALAKSNIRPDQQAWLKYVLAACRDVAAMKQAYATRITTLRFAVNPTPAPSNPQFTLLQYSTNEYSGLTQIRSVPPHPVIERFNAWLRASVAEHPSATYYIDSTEIIAGRYVSTYLRTEDYFPGAAHGMPVRASLTLDLVTGKEVTLESLFRPGSQFAELLATLVNDDLLTSWRHGGWQYEGSQVASGLEGPPTDLFNLISGGLALHYPPYRLGPYSSGDANIYIPYAKLASAADVKGPLAAAGKLPFTQKHDWQYAPVVPDLPRPPWKGLTKANPRDGQLYVFIPSGEFKMGCDSQFETCGPYSAKPAHMVRISKGFWISQDPATQEVYKRVTGETPSRFEGSANLPVEMINWKEADDYCKAIGGRLPTEAEWEYAARGGNPRPLYGKPDEIAWHSLNSNQVTHSVGQRPPNSFGLYDAIGNVEVWTADWGDRKYPDHLETDPIANTPSGRMVTRGAGTSSHPTQIQVWTRNTVEPSTRSDSIGVRCIANLP